MNDDLVARLRALADRTWSDPIGAGLTRHGHVLDDDDRALLHEAADTIESMVARGALVMDDWIGDAESIIHQHCGSDGSDDAHNDWVHDLASELWSHFGTGNAAASGIDALDVLDEHITRLIEAGDALYDRIAPATNTTDATQLEAWLAAVSAINERTG